MRFLAIVIAIFKMWLWPFKGCKYANRIIGSIMYAMDFLRKFITWHCVSLVTLKHYSDVIMGAMAPQITSLAIVYSTVYSGTDQRKHQSSASLTFVRGIHRWPVNSPHKWPVTRKIFSYDDVIMNANLIVTGDIGYFHHDLRWHQWRQRWHPVDSGSVISERLYDMRCYLRA